MGIQSMIFFAYYLSVATIVIIKVFVMRRIILPICFFGEFAIC